MRWLLTTILVLVSLLGARAALAQSTPVAERIEKANRALEAGEYEDARVQIHALLDGGSRITRAERGEAFRILALLNFFLGNGEQARAAFLEFLRTDPDAHLDPALVPPEAISLLEDVRARNSADLNAFRKKPKKKRYLLLNLVPTAGQFQNGESTKGIILAGSLAVLLTANVTSYFLFKRYCDAIDKTCSSGDEDKASTARSLQGLNTLSGVGLVSLYAYSVVDGWLGYRQIQRKEKAERDSYMSLRVLPEQDGASVSWSLRF